MGSESVGRSCIRLVVRLLIAFFICMAAFLVLSILTYCIPTGPMESHLRESAEQLAAEGLYHPVIEGGPSQKLDNWTVATMLNEAAHGSDDPIRGALLNPKTDVGDGMIGQFADGIGVPDKDVTSDYPQYWHGYLAFLKPTLLLLSLAEIRELSAVVFFCLLGLVAVLLSKRGSTIAGVVVVVSFVAFNPFVMINSLSLSVCPYIALIAMLFVLWKTKGGNRLLSAGAMWWAVPFFVIGGLTAYFDFLCTPIVTLGMPLALLVFVSRGSIDRKNVLRCALGLLGLCLCWALGYVSLWASKWIIAGLITGEDIIAMGLEKVAERSSERASEAVSAPAISRMDAIVKNRDLAFPRWSVRLCVVGSVVLTAVIVALHIKRKELPTLWWILPLGMTAVLPYVWYVFAANHSYQHCMFTYRSQIVFLFAVLLFFAGMLFSQPRTAKHLTT